MNRLFACTVLLLAASPAFAADANGYTAKYECRAGAPYCNVDVSALVNQSCQQIISASTPWSNINWSNNVICIEAGDHTAKGRLVLQSSGTSGARKVLRYFRSNDTDDDPWNQSAATQARLYAIDANAKKYWLIHRLTIDPSYGSTNGVELLDGSNGNILNRMLIQRTDGRLVEIYGNNNTVQNSVLRTTKTRNDALENQCISIANATNTTIVNNEAYDCNKASHIPGNSPSPGTVLENNDFYVSTAGYTDCNGRFTPTGSCSIMEALISWKSGGSSDNPSKIIHNRLWGTRWADGNLIQAGDSPAISLSATGDGDAGADYVVVQHNIITDSEVGIWNYWGGPDHNSILGNLLYGIKDRTPNLGGESGALTNWRMNNSEFYFNTVIDSSPWLRTNLAAAYNDVRCNVVINSGAQSGDNGPGVQIDYNAYYGVSSVSDSHAITRSLVTRTSSADYGTGTILRTGDTGQCVSGAESACFLFLVTQGGRTAATAPAYCTTLGCTVTDGTVQVKAIRGPYVYARKLKTSPSGEIAVVPYARVHVSAPETGGCPSSTDPARPGSRSDIGIDNNLLY